MKPFAVILIAVVVVAGGVMAWRMRSASAEPAGVVTLTGRLEGDDSAVAARTAGRVVRIAVREGDPVKAGDVIAVLDDDQVGAREEQARAALAQAEARSRGAREQIAVLEQQLRQVELQTEQSWADADGRVRQAEADLAGAGAQLAREQAALQIAQFDKEAYAKLAQSGAVSERQGKQAASVADQQAAVVAAALTRVDAARGGLGAARSMLTNPEIRMAQSAAIKGQIAQARAEIAGSVAQTGQASRTSRRSLRSLPRGRPLLPAGILNRLPNPQF